MSPLPLSYMAGTYMSGTTSTTASVNPNFNVIAGHAVLANDDADEVKEFMEGVKAVLMMAEGHCFKHNPAIFDGLSTVFYGRPFYAFALAFGAGEHLDDIVMPMYEQYSDDRMGFTYETRYLVDPVYVPNNTRVVKL